MNYPKDRLTLRKIFMFPLFLGWCALPVISGFLGWPMLRHESLDDSKIGLELGSTLCALLMFSIIVCCIFDPKTQASVPDIIYYWVFSFGLFLFTALGIFTINQYNEWYHK